MAEPCLAHADPDRLCPDCAAAAHATLCLSLLVERQTGMPRWQLAPAPRSAVEKTPTKLRRIA